MLLVVRRPRFSIEELLVVITKSRFSSLEAKTTRRWSRKGRFWIWQTLSMMHARRTSASNCRRRRRQAALAKKIKDGKMRKKEELN